ncbi:hypothetical protein RSP673_011160 [Ralstonia solanacearum P673]|uniref:hypothetical protein n=1 Tax=Ralstonia solanacearum TaxID=305 RepID=UPI000448C2E7|nr:hypothetical protein [Ralstonia solanacearum]EUJ15165.1 hypothetical protein RSP673_07035 [Ralstonia solanacearum P673]MCL9851194.1 hypothetical protein [Ralstonia solanacearum]MCL9855771.1 hypothetical protein [Ralstonia solanacearum]MCL9860287.1 hypothetical protein [Ralstonia solanacearum]MCL9865518.1 hypothetical protein [Ralstonia solanacearum]
MSPFELWCECRRLSVRLTVHGDRLRYKGPEDAVKAVLPLLAEHKAALVACVADLARYPVADGPFMPYMTPLSPERVAGLLTDLRKTIGKVADIEGWPDDYRAHLLGLVARQPVSTLADDLAYFRERLNTAAKRTSRNSVTPSADSPAPNAPLNVPSEHIVKDFRSEGSDVCAGGQIAQIGLERRRAL